MAPQAGPSSGADERGERSCGFSGAAALTGLDQPKVSALVNGRLGGFSSERLMRCLTALGQDVEIVVKTRTRAGARGRLRVVEKAA